MGSHQKKWKGGYYVALLLGFLLILPPVHNQLFKLWFYLNGRSETISVTFKIDDLVSNGMKEEHRAEVTTLLLQSLKSVVVQYEPVVSLEGVTQNTKRWWSYEGLVGIGGIGWLERNSSTDLYSYSQKAKIVNIDLTKAEVLFSFKLEPILHYRPRYIELEFIQEPKLDSLIDYRLNGVPATAAKWTLDIPIIIVVDGKQDFYHNSRDSNYRRTGIYFMRDSSPYAKHQWGRPTDHAELIFSLQIEHQQAEHSDVILPEISIKVTNITPYEQPRLSKKDREELTFMNNSERDIYRLRREWYDYARNLDKQRTDYILPGYLEKGLVVEAANILDLNIYRTLNLPTSGSDYLSFDEHWQVSQGQLMHVELISSGYEGSVNMSSCGFGAEIERDAAGELRRYFNQWFFKEAQKNVEIDIDHPASLQQVIEQTQVSIQHQRRSQSPSEVITSGDEEDCAVKLKYVQQLLLMSEDELLARLAYLKKVIVPK